MRAFAALYAALDVTTSTTAKVEALVRYLGEAPPGDAAWALHFLLGRRPRRLVRAGHLRAWAAEAAGIPAWLVEECYEAAGDLAETIALLVPDGAPAAPRTLEAVVTEELLALAGLPATAQRDRVLAAWGRLTRGERFVWNKLLTGAFRVGLSDGLVVRAVAAHVGASPEEVAHRLMGPWEPSAAFLASLRDGAAAATRPYPFLLAAPLDGPVTALGDARAWQAEWKRDGIRAQLIRRVGRTSLWSRGEELLDGRFPEVEAAATALPDGTVLDGELVVWRGGVRPFAELQRRIGRKAPSARLLAELPVVLIAYDLLEDGGIDVRPLPLAERRSRLEARLAGTAAALRLDPLLDAADWPALAARRAEARAAGAEGLMLKRRDAAYGVGRRGGDWVKWKVDPFSVDAVLVAAQAGHGRRAGLFTDYTFAVRDGDAFVPFAKAYSGLTDDELRRVDAFVRRHVTGRFGPVRTVEPRLVFEIAFEGIQPSPRHKSGVAVRFPRIARWRDDKPVAEIDTLDTLRTLVRAAAG